MLPLALDLTGRRVVVVGATAAARDKARRVEEAGGVPELLDADTVTGFTGALLVIVATGDRELDRRLGARARAQECLVNVVDDPEHCDVFFTAVHRDGDVTVAVSTGGASPALATALRDRVAAALPRGVGAAAATLRAERERWRASGRPLADHDWAARAAELLGD